MKLPLQSKCCRNNALINSKLQQICPPPPSSGKARAFHLLKIGSLKFPPPRGKMVFVCHTLLKNNRHWLLSSSIIEDLFRKPISHKCYISSFKLFHLVQTRVLKLLVTLAPPQKKDLKRDTSGSIFPTPRRHTSNSRGGGGGEAMLKFRFDRRINQQYFPMKAVGITR